MVSFVEGEVCNEVSFVEGEGVLMRCPLSE